MEKVRRQVSTCSGPACELQLEKLGPALAKTYKRVTLLLRGEKFLEQTERLKMWRDSEGR